MARDKIKTISCRYLFIMANNLYIDNLLSCMRLILLLNKPAIVKDLKFHVYFKDHIINQEYIREGVISTYIETDTHYSYKDLCGFTEPYGKTISKEEAETHIITDISLYYDYLIDEEHYLDFWKEIDFDDGDWKRKEE